MSSRDFFVQPCQPYSSAYPISSRLSSLTEWRRLSKLLRPRVSSSRSADSAVVAAVGSLDPPVVELVQTDLGRQESEPEAAAATVDPVSDPNLPLKSISSNNLENDPTRQIGPSPPEIPENDQPVVAARNQENVPVLPSSLDPVVSTAISSAAASPNAESIQSLRSGEATETDEGTSVGNLSSSAIIDNESTTNESIGNIVPNAGVEGEVLRIPSAVYGVQIQSPSLLGAQLLGEALVPVLFATQSSSLNSSSNARSATTEDSFTTISSGDKQLVKIMVENFMEVRMTELGVYWERPLGLKGFAKLSNPSSDGPNVPRTCVSEAHHQEAVGGGVVSVNGGGGGLVGSGVGGGMDCMPLRPGPFHYLISEQAKSLVALQELQNEVGALLEFRDLVIETFPNLRHKMAVTAAVGAGVASSGTSPASSATSCTNANGASSSAHHSHQGAPCITPLSSQSPSSRRMGECWEPGKVRRRVAAAPRENESTTSLPRSRSNSHSGGNKQHSATVQDSGFSTETSSKDSASTAIACRPQSPGSAASGPGRPQSAASNAQLDDAEDELWNLLDVIHRKGVRLREEVESLQGRLESVAPEELEVPSDIAAAVRKVTRTRRRRRQQQQRRLDPDDEAAGEGDAELDSRDDEADEPDDEDDDDDDDEADEDLQHLGEDELARLRREKLQLLDKVAELEAETIASRARAQELQAELASLAQLRHGLEDRLLLRPGAAAGAKLERCLQPIEPEPQSPRSAAQSGASQVPALVDIGGRDSAFASVVSSNKAHKSRFRTRTIEKSALSGAALLQFQESRSSEDLLLADTRQPTVVPVDGSSSRQEALLKERRARLGALDSVLVSPVRRLPAPVVRSQVDERKIAAILRERSPLELQRHLITSTVHNQVLQRRLDEVEKSTETLSDRLGKAHDENEDLRFQLAERSIELEGTRARVRVLERLQQRPTTETDADDESDVGQHPQAPLLPRLLNGSGGTSGLESSGTESLANLSGSRDLVNGHLSASTPTPLQPQPKSSPRRKPSRIPLPGTPNSSTSSATPLSSPANPQKPVAPRAPSTSHRRNDSRDSLASKSSLQSGAQTTSRPTTRQQQRDSSGRESLSLGKSSSVSGRSLTRSATCNSNSNSLQKRSSSPRRPPAPARRSHPQTAPVQAQSGAQDSAAAAKSLATSEVPSSWLSSSCNSEGSPLYPDSLESNSRADHRNKNSENNRGDYEDEEDDDETSSRTASTRVEFIIGSPTRKRPFRAPWMDQYLDSIDPCCSENNCSPMQPCEAPGREALAECDSLEPGNAACDELASGTGRSS